MFRMGLLTSTAMTAVALLLWGAPTGAYAQTDMHAASRDPNIRFLCTYGQLFVSASHYSESGYGYYSRWREVAVPVRGHGQKVRRIRIVEGNLGLSAQVMVGIYSNAPSGFPGELIAGGYGRVNSSACGPISIRIPPTRLKNNKTYWIEERASADLSGSATVLYWIANPNTKHEGYVQTHWFHRDSRCSVSCTSSYTSPWTKQTTGPYLKLR